MDLFVENAGDIPLRSILPKIQKRIMLDTTYFGVRTLKNPFDHWVYQEIIFAQQPDLIVEIGTNWGGSTLAMAHMLDNIGKGHVVGIDVDQSKTPDIVREHERITLIEKPALDALQDVLAKRTELGAQNILIIEDSLHTYKHTKDVLDAYSHLIPKGGYFIVEDGICHYGLDTGPSPGAYEASDEFVNENADKFEIDRSKESFIITWNPKGFIRRK